MNAQSGSDGYNPQAYSFGNPYWSNIMTPHRGAGEGSLGTPSSSDESGYLDGSGYVYPGSDQYGTPSGIGQSLMTPECSPPEDTVGQKVERKPSGGGKIRRKNNKTDNKRDVIEVQGRLSIVNNQRTYNVYPEELNRRIHGPEQMNSSTLSALCRKSKVSNCGAEFRGQLSQMGVSVSTNTRKAKETTAFTALTEEESVQVSSDFDVLVQTEFPKQALAEKMVDANAADLPRFMEQCKAALFVKHQMDSILGNVLVPLGRVKKEDITETGAFQDGMERISALTHGFVMKNMMTSSRLDIEIMQRVVVLCEERLGLRPAQSHQIQQLQMQPQWDPSYPPHPMMVPQMGMPMQPNMGQQMWHGA